MTKPLDDRLALVTGATRGLGRAIAERLLNDGARVIGTGSKPEGTAPAGCDYRAVDFTDAGATQAFADEAAGLGIEILVNNAGTTKLSDFTEIAPDDFTRIQQVNVTAPFMLSRAVVPGMKERGWGRIVQIASIFGIVSRQGRASYSTSKAALDGMTAALSS
ncbi:MAG: SDR family oxidoreductase, partial [Rhodospirillales bacterium]|nr:SDR family oxidoreductase [Rhodospirillales bacterium]